MLSYWLRMNVVSLRFLPQGRMIVTVATCLNMDLGLFGLSLRFDLMNLVVVVVSFMGGSIRRLALLCDS